MLLAGDRLNAREAYQFRLVNSVVPKPTLLPVAENLAPKIATNNQPVVRWAKQAVQHGFDLPLQQALETERELATLALTARIKEAHHKKPGFKSSS